MSEVQKTPGALAGTTGADIEGFWSRFDDNLSRKAQASAVVAAVLECDPEDRVLFLEAILDQIRPGWPQAYYCNLMEEAAWWADNSSRAERKAYCLACFNRMPARDQAAFLDYVQGRSAA